MNARHLATAGRYGLAIVAVIATIAALAESYHALQEWALRAGVGRVWSYVWPLMVDTLVVGGELTLLVATVENWRRWARGPAWCVTLTGLVVSVAGNVGNAPAELAKQATHGLAPVAAAAAIALGLQVLKRSSTLAQMSALRQEHDGEDDSTDVTRDSTEPVATRATASCSDDGQSDNGTTAPTGADLEAAAVAILSDEPDISGAELGRRLGVSERRGQRLARELREPTSEDGHQLTALTEELTE